MLKNVNANIFNFFDTFIFAEHLNSCWFLVYFLGGKLFILYFRKPWIQIVNCSLFFCQISCLVRGLCIQNYWVHIHPIINCALIVFYRVEIPFDFFSNIISVNRHNVLHHAFQLQIVEEIVKAGDINKKDVWSFLSCHSELSNRYFMISVASLLHISEMS